MKVELREQLSELIKLHPLVAEWFYSKYRELSPPQKFALKEVVRGKNILISSPTGSGKTLAAFLTAISRLVEYAEKGELKDRIYVVYVSPLRALNNDIQRNLEEPLTEIYKLASRKGIKLQKIRVGVRTGDTDCRERSRQLRKPPHILITTPETLAIVLSSPKFAENLRNVMYLIVDEVHALAENKRGSHLTLSMERLENIQEGKMLRIGLSATIAPLEEVAKFLAGYENGKERECVAVDVTFSKPMEIKVITPVTDFFTTTAEETGENLYNTIAELVRRAKTALVFTNTRSATERVVYQLKKRLPEWKDAIKAHHSSLSREVRLDVENELKTGKLKCVVSSTSLELGIDIGYIDLVILIGSPKSINRALQRIGRSGHRMHEVSRGRIVVVDQDDLIECTVLAKEAMDRKLDRIKIPQKPLDVLCQHIVGMAIEKKWKIDEALKVVRSAYPYRNLSREEFLSVLRYLAGKYTVLEEKNVYGKIWLDEESGEFGRRGKLIRPIYYMNVGTIPDEVAIKVITKDGKFVGKVEEEFAERLVKGDIFVLAGRTFKFLHSKGLQLVVEEVEGEKPTVPSWFSEQLPLSYDLAQRIQEFRSFIASALDSINPAYLASLYNLDVKAAKAILSYFEKQRNFSVIPTRDIVLVEAFEDEEFVLVFHTLVGRRANSALARVFAYRAGKICKRNVRIAFNDNGFMLRLPSPIEERELKNLFRVSEFKDDLEKALDRTEIMKRRFRHVAVRSFMILRKYMGREKSVWRQQLNAEILLNLIKKTMPDFPVLRETYREIMEDSMHVDEALDFLRSIEEGRRKIVFRIVPSPSPFSFNLYIMSDEDAVLMEDRKKVLMELHEKVLKFSSSSKV
jgi:ATP-dependent Lhr-like helicase